MTLRERWRRWRRWRRRREDIRRAMSVLAAVELGRYLAAVADGRPPPADFLARARERAYRRLKRLDAGQPPFRREP